MVADNESVVRFVSEQERIRKEQKDLRERAYKVYGVPEFGAIRIPLRDDYALDDCMDILEDFIKEVRKIRESRIMEGPQLMLHVHRLLRFASDSCMKRPLRDRLDELGKGK